MISTRFYSALALVGVILFCSVASRAQSDADDTPQFTPYKLLKKTIVGGEGGWDYVEVDSRNRHLFISHGTQVDIYDLDNDSIVGHIMNTEGVHDICIVARENKGFISCGKSNSVLMFDLRTFDTLKRIKVGEKPDAELFDPASYRVYVMNGKSHTISALDAANGRLISTIKLPGAPEAGVADTWGHVYVNIEDKSKIVKINSRQDKIMETWPVAPGEEPSGIAMDRPSRRIFSACGNEKLIVMKDSGAKRVAVLPVGKGVDGLVFDPYNRLAFTPNGADGTVTIVREVGANNYEVVQTLPTQRGARTIALDPKTHCIYLPTAEFGPAPEPTKENPKPRPSIVPGSFMILKYGPGQ